MNDSNVQYSANEENVDLCDRSLATAFQWHVDNGLAHVWADEPVAYLDQKLVRSLDAPVNAPVNLTADVKKVSAPVASSTSVNSSSLVDPNTLEGLYAEINAFDACELKETAINTVIADGNPQADIMLIGEAPGADEDRSGKPFVGEAGQLLDKMIAAIGLNREQVLVTNLVFWRPPGNRKPTASESEMCLSFTKRHIELVRPKIIVFVGALSAQKLLNTVDGITRIRGRWHPYTLNDGSEVTCMPLLHPAYLLRQPRYKRESWMDLIEVRKKIIELGL